MISKYFEIRDRGTLIVCRADKFEVKDIKEALFLRRGGWSIDYPDVVLTTLNGGIQSNYDPFKWNSGTLHEAHLYIRENFDKLTDYQVIDTQYIRGESETPKESEILSQGLIL